MHTLALYRYFSLFCCYYLLLIQKTHFFVNGANSGNKLFTNCINTNSSASIYDYSFYDIRDDKKQNLISLSKYEGKTLVIVNTATYCGYTHQYPHFNKLKDHYSLGDFEILAFPCNQFGLQEPGENGNEILNGIRYVRPGNNYKTNFPMFAKIDVNGRDEHPLFTFLKSVCPSPTDEFHSWPSITYKPMRSQDVRWNFVKFLIDSNGQPVKRFSSDVTPAQLQSHIDAVKKNSASKRRYEYAVDQLDQLFNEDDNSK